jgi:uncharacterized membrane protein
VEFAMTAFTVWKFDDPEGADRSCAVLEAAERDGLVKILDHAVVSWPQGASRPSTEHSHDTAKTDTGWGALWGLVVGSLFLMPLLGAAAGAGIGALHGAMKGIGITKEQLETIRSQVTEGTSALFLMTEEGNLDRLGERFHGEHSKLIATNLTAEERSLLLETFGDDTVPSHRWS